MGDKEMNRKIIFKERNQGTEKGFTLLEVMVALGILSVGILAVASMQAAAIRFNSSAGDITEAVALAGEQMEKLIALPYNDDLLKDTDEDGLDGLQDAADDTADQRLVLALTGKYTLYWNVAVDKVATGTKTVNVIVTWHDRRGERRLSIQHVIPNL